MPFPKFDESEYSDPYAYQIAQQQRLADLADDPFYAGGTAILSQPAPRIGDRKGSFLGSFLPAFTQPIVGGFARGFGQGRVDNAYDNPSSGYLGLLSQAQSASPEEYQDILKSNPKFQKKFGAETGLFRSIRQSQKEETQKEDQLNLLKIIPELQKAGIDASPLLKKAGLENLAITESPEKKAKSFEASSSLRKELTNSDAFKNYTTTKGILDSLNRSASENSPSGDLDFVYGIAKILDPGSVVRESEQKIITSASSPLNRFKGALEGVLGGARMPPEVRKQLLTVANSRLQSSKASYDQYATTLKDVGERQGLDSRDFIVAPIEQQKGGEAPQIIPVTLPNGRIIQVPSNDPRLKALGIAQ
jgi:hypothetical protein